MSEVPTGGVLFTCREEIFFTLGLATNEKSQSKKGGPAYAKIQNNG
jgi:hypothetical protein